MAAYESLRRAAQNVLTRGLRLRDNQNLLIIADIAALPVVELMVQEADAREILVTCLYVPRLLQEVFLPTDQLPAPVESAIREADAIMSCLSDQAKHKELRARVLQTSLRRHAKAAHAPGLTLDILQMADTDYDQIQERCRLLALALVMGRTIEIVTLDHTGAEHRLSASSGGWEFPPGISDGVIQEGSWANLPPGETFIVPRGGTGEIAINGSIPGMVLTGRDSIVLTFENGHMTAMSPNDSPPARHLYNTQIAHAVAQGDANWSNLAEIGFGANPSVKSLIGIELIDEKKADTIHIALGESRPLGGSVDSTIHCDLVIEEPTVYIDGLPILEQGQWRLQETDWVLDHRHVDLPAAWWEQIDWIQRTGSRAETVENRLVRHWGSSSGRRNSLPVGADATAKMAARVYGILPEHGEAIDTVTLTRQVQHIGVDPANLPAIIAILERFDLVRVRQETDI